MIEIKKILICELENFINSTEYLKMKNKPISQHRALSYINNPRADKNDATIYLITNDNQIIAYRCMLSDKIFLNNTFQKIYWISGSWVEPNFRRLGYSLQLMNYIVNDLKEYIFFSNFAPQSKALYDKSNFFDKIYQLDGKRFYFNLSLNQIFTAKYKKLYKFKSLFLINDKIFNKILKLRNIFWKTDIDSLKFCFIDKLDKNSEQFISKINQKNIFKRNILELNHIKNYPWLVQTPIIDLFSKQYYFSAVSENFTTNFVKIFDNNFNIVSIFVYKQRDRNIEIPYIFYEDKLIVNQIFAIISQIIKKQNIFHITLYDKNLIQIFENNKKYLYSKKFEKSFFASKTFIENNKDFKFEIYSGDGDNIFT